MSTRTTRPRRRSAVSGSELSHTGARSSAVSALSVVRGTGLRGAHDYVLDLRHVAPGGCGSILRAAATLASVEIGRVPVPPIVRRGRLLERVVMLGRFVQELGEPGDVHRHTRPGSRSVISCSCQVLPSGSAKDARLAYDWRCGSMPGTGPLPISMWKISPT